MTFEHWFATQEDGALGRHPISLGAFAGGELRATVRYGNRCPAPLDVRADDADAACTALSALFVSAASHGDARTSVAALIQRYTVAVEQAITRAEFTPGDASVVLARRIAQMVRDEARVRVRMATVR